MLGAVDEKAAVDHTNYSMNDLVNMLPYDEVEADPGDTLSVYEVLSLATEAQIKNYEAKNDLNLNLLDYLTNYKDGETLSNIGLYQPPQTASTDSVLYGTKEDFTKLKIGRVNTERREENTIVVTATARYKPENDETHETDQYGYMETDPIEAFRITDLSELEAALIEVFVPIAVNEIGSDAGFRENATKTNSLIDRLKAITLPLLDDIEDELQHYLTARARAEELDAKIAEIDDLVDQIVYSLYGLTEEEIEIVEQSVAG